MTDLFADVDPFTYDPDYPGMTSDEVCRPPLYVDVAAILDTTAEPVTPTAGGIRDDGLPLLYAGAVNMFIGDPETGKTLICAAMAVQALRDGGRVLWCDLDHNGRSIIDRLLMLGARAEHLRNPERFRFAEPDDRDTFAAIVSDTAAWSPTIAVVDSIGELLPMFGASSDNADEFTRVNRVTLRPLARSGAAVIALDHLAKGATSREYGGTGTIAKKRAVDGVMYRITATVGLIPGKGGTVLLSVVKDRHGGIRSRCERARERQEPTAARFEMWHTAGRDDATWRFTAPSTASDAADAGLAEDVRRMQEIQPKSLNDARKRSGFRAVRSDAAYRVWMATIASDCDPETAPRPPRPSRVPDVARPTTSARPTPLGGTWDAGRAPGVSDERVGDALRDAVGVNGIRDEDGGLCCCAHGVTFGARCTRCGGRAAS